ncbi:hypothetical protein ONZ45_g4131 [Pleurotus djamor]|nr:hypothetical protein ONZ45_g4131 [Pleurotus djamor]
MRSAFILLALTTLVVARPSASAIGDMTKLDNLDDLIEKSWQTDIAGQDFEAMTHGRRRRVRKFIKKLIKAEVKKAIANLKPSGGSGGGGGQPAGGDGSGSGGTGGDGASGGDAGTPSGGGDGAATPTDSAGGSTPTTPACPA